MGILFSPVNYCYQLYIWNPYHLVSYDASMHRLEHELPSTSSDEPNTKVCIGSLKAAMRSSVDARLTTLSTSSSKLTRWYMKGMSGTRIWRLSMVTVLTMLLMDQ
ncbi:hypothetical protein PTI98_004798 [Pleurotus ostreatus]|nr:hypothetical protein PTI98_004798 [Pleurotus ostreatus]